MAQDLTKDTTICPSLGMHDQQTINQREEERILHNITKQHGVIQPKTINADFHIELEGLPCDKGQPVILYVNDVEVYNSGDQAGEIPVWKKTIPGEPNKPYLDVRLKIAVMGFDNKFSIDKVEGQYFKLKGSERGLEKMQQKNPF